MPTAKIPEPNNLRFKFGTPEAIWDSGEIIKQKKKIGSNVMEFVPDEDIKYSVKKLDQIFQRRKSDI